MDTPQPPPIVTQPLKRKERSPSPARRTPGHTSTPGSRSSPTSLPSIRHFLPPQPDPQLGERYHPNRQQAGPAFSAGPSAGIPRLDFLPPPAQPPAERTHPGIVADSDGDGDSEQAARPKQKRRRQALSCTECKRRKIKCDRAHPCTPCIRRGDQNKCQWHVIEPVDKYVSRAEYDELRARVDRLETLLLSRAHQPSGFATLPGPEPSSSQTQQQQQLGTTAPVPYNSISPSSSSTPGAAFPAGLAGPSRVVAGSHDYGGAMALRAPNSPASGRTALPPLASLANGPAPFDGGPPPPSRLHREQHQYREHREREREQQHQPYAPFPPQPSLQQPLQQLHQQTKNYRAQTLIPLGERLRNCISLQGPAAVSRLHRHRSNSTHRLRLLVRGARGRRFHTAPAYRGLLLFLGPHRSGVPSVRSENGSSSSSRLSNISLGWGV
ncbi:hypothetical protein BC826DRAFT_466459 [Russula brevipes]|nr:hypothetical protein BC826DRAFT_466459 [Russula brevipes]